MTVADFFGAYRALLHKSRSGRRAAFYSRHAFVANVRKFVRLHFTESFGFDFVPAPGVLEG